MNAQNLIDAGERAGLKYRTDLAALRSSCGRASTIRKVALLMAKKLTAEAGHKGADGVLYATGVLKGLGVNS